MGLKHNNLNGEIVLAIKLTVVEQFFWKIVKIAFRNECYKLFFQEDAQIAWKNKIVQNFHITYPNGMNQSFTHRLKYNL